MTAPKKPQDHLPKHTDDDDLYEFIWADTTYRLPPADRAINQIPGRTLRDAFMEGEEGQMRLGFAMLEHSDAGDAMDALYEMPAPAMLDHLQKWMETRTRPDGATVGESSRSST